MIHRVLARISGFKPGIADTAEILTGLNVGTDEEKQRKSSSGYLWSAVERLSKIYNPDIFHVSDFSTSRPDHFSGFLELIN